MRPICVSVLAGLSCLKMTSASLFGAQQIWGHLIDPHIAGGVETRPNEHPHQVALTDENGFFFCSGSLISETFAITAAHCVHGRSDVTVLLGVHNLELRDFRVISVPVQSIIVHENYNRQPKRNDIALLELQYNISKHIDADYINIIRLPRISERNQSYGNYYATLLGWGKIRNRFSPTSEALLSVTVPVMLNHDCIFPSYEEFDGNQQLCTSGYGGKGGCFGDSGSPLIIEESDRTKTLIGIASFIGDVFNCLSEKPTAFTRVTAFLDWIQTHSNIKLRP